MSKAQQCLPVALVLHAHLPYVQEDEAFHPCERWFHEAVWECYLPLVSMLDRLADDQVNSPFTLSVSPPLCAMLNDSSMQRRFEQHLDAVEALNCGPLPHGGGDQAFSSVRKHYHQQFQTARAVWRRHHGNLLYALNEHRKAGRIQLMTTAASHAFLPGLLPIENGIEAQLLLGAAQLRALTHQEPQGVWLPECAYAPSIDDSLARAGYRHTVVDAHALPATPAGTTVLAPARSQRDIVYFPRDPQSARQIWSRKHGFPGHPSYRDFYRDLGQELDAHSLAPFQAGSMTGLKYFRITGTSEQKEAYVPEAGQHQSLRHAEQFISSLRKRQCERNSVLVAAYDAELFGHWWHEGPLFLESVLRQLDRVPKLRAVSLEQAAQDVNFAHIIEPRQSSWGEGGFSGVWVGQGTAELWPKIHRAHRAVVRAIHQHRIARGPASAALDQAIVQLLLLEASDWLFMIHQGECSAYARRRFAQHLEATERHTALSTSPTRVRSRAWAADAEMQHPLLKPLPSEEIRRALAPATEPNRALALSRMQAAS